MPIVIPIEGAVGSASDTVTYTGYGSISVVAKSKDPAYTGIDVLGTTKSEGYGGVWPYANRSKAVFSSISPSNFALYSIHASLEVILGESFLTIVDLMSDEFYRASIENSILEINARLTVGEENTEVPIKSFRYNVPSGSLGATLDIVLKNPDEDSVPFDSPFTFALVITLPDGEGGFQEYEHVLMTGGKIKEKTSTVAYRRVPNDGPADEIRFSAFDIINDVFSKGPRRPVTMFNPTFVDFDEISTDTQDQVVDEDTGKIIYPVLEPVPGLKMSQVLRRAYASNGGFGFIGAVPGTQPWWDNVISTASNDQEGCGFSEVVTNISDYQVRRADFTLQGGWHEGAQPVVSMYAPIYFVDGSRLFIIDPDKRVPAGTTAHPISLARHKTFSEQIKFQPDRNAVLLTFQFGYNDNTLTRTVFSDTSEEIGTAGEPGYSKITTRRFDYEYYSADDPDTVLGTNPKSVEVETRQTVLIAVDTGAGIEYTNYGVRVTHQETTTYQYKQEMLERSTKIIKAMILAGPSASLTLQEVWQETVEADWKDDPYNPGVKLQSRVRIDEKGILAYTQTPETITGYDGAVEDVVRGVPILTAQSGGLLNASSYVSPGMLPIKSVRQRLIRLNGKQFHVETIETDYLNNTLKKSFDQPTTGSVIVDQFESRSKTVLLRDEDSEAEIGTRVPLEINAYELPRDKAIALGKNVLQRLRNPLSTMPIDLVSVHFGIKQGSVIKCEKRNGTYTNNYFVTGYSIEGKELGIPERHRINQSLEAVEMLEQLVAEGE